MSANKTNAVASLSTLIENVPHKGRHYELAGVEWFLTLDSEQLLFCRRGDLIVALHPGRTKPGVCWSWTWQLGNGIPVMHHATEDSLEAAAKAALTFAPEETQFEYLGEQITWYSVKPGRWCGIVQGERADVLEVPAEETIDKLRCFGWMRRYAAGAEVFKFVGGHELQGMAADLRSAFIACVDAPTKFRAACGALIAQLTSDRRPV